MRRSVLLLAAIAAAIALLGSGWWLGQREPADLETRVAARGSGAEIAAATSPDAEPLAAARTPRDESVAASATAPPTLSTSLGSEPLPPADALVSEIYDDLLTRAQRGDARAACRLGAELQRCQRAQLRGEVSPDMTRRIARADSEPQRDAMIDFIARFQEEQERAQRVCVGLATEQLDVAFELQMQAAQATPALRTWAALNPALDPRWFVDDLDRWQRYRASALPWLEAAAAQGDLAAVVAMARIHGDDRDQGVRAPLFRQLDAERALTYWTLLQHYGVEFPFVQRQRDHARAQLDPQRQAAAERRAQELFQPGAVVPPSHRRAAHAAAVAPPFGRFPTTSDCE